MKLWNLAGGAVVTLAGIAALGRAVPQAQSGPVRLTLTTGAALRSWDLTVDRMLQDGALNVRRTDVDSMMPTRTHERLRQYHRGLPVYGADIARQTDAGVTVSLFGLVYPDIDINTTPDLSVEDAAAIIKQDSGADLGPSKLPTLMILPQVGSYRLVYHARAFTTHGGAEYFIDAATGTIIQRLDAVQRQSAIGIGTGVLNDKKKMSATSGGGTFTANDALRPPLLLTFDMKGNLQRTIDFLSGFITLGVSDRATDADNVWTDSATVDAHAYAGYTYDYYYKRFGRRGLDNNNLRILSLVHPAPRSQVLSQPSDVVEEFYLNAGYYGGGVMVYGEGLPANVTADGQNWNYLAGALDVVGHELTHGVTEYTSDLLYQNESGALNEAFSDMMGTAIEFYYQTAGTGTLRADYLVGEDVVTPGGLRSLANPGAYGQPDHYSKRVVYSTPTDDNDNGGVHTNSGIVNQWYYLAIEGGTNRTSGLTVTGVGTASREQVEKIAYRAFTQMLPSNATFATARAATIQSARDLYGVNSNAERAVSQAWTAVGVN